MARDPRGVPDVVFKPTKYMNFVGALGKRKELEANREMERAKQVKASLPEAEMGEYSANWRPFANQAFKKFMQYRNETISKANDLSREELAKRRSRLVTMKSELAGMAKDMSNMGGKLESAEKDLQAFYEENNVSGSPEAYIRQNEGTEEAQTLKSILSAINVYSGKPLPKAEVGYDESGKINFSAPEISANSLDEYVDYRETYQIKPTSFEKLVKDGKVVSIATKKVPVNGKDVKKFDKNKFRRTFGVAIMEKPTPDQKKNFKTYYRQTNNSSEAEAEKMWQEMVSESDKNNFNETAQEYFDYTATIAESKVDESVTGGGSQNGGGGPKTSDLPGSSFELDLDVLGPAGYVTSVAGDIGEVMLPENVQSKAIALEEGKHKINVNEADFVDETGDVVEVTDGSVERLYRDNKGDYYALVKGLTKEGKDLWSKGLLKLKDSQLSSLQESLGSKVKEIGIDQYYDKVTGESVAKTEERTSDNNVDYKGLPSNKINELAKMQDMTPQELFDTYSLESIKETIDE